MGPSAVFLPILAFLELHSWSYSMSGSPRGLQLRALKRSGYQHSLPSVGFPIKRYQTTSFSFSFTTSRSPLFLPPLSYHLPPFNNFLDSHLLRLLIFLFVPHSSIDSFLLAPRTRSLAPIHDTSPSFTTIGCLLSHSPGQTIAAT